MYKRQELKDVAALKEKIEAVDHVKKVLWYDSVLDVSVPVEMLPKDLREAFFNGDATMMIALFDNTTSSDAAMEAVSVRSVPVRSSIKPTSSVASSGSVWGIRKNHQLSKLLVSGWSAEPSSISPPQKP